MSARKVFDELENIFGSAHHKNLFTPKRGPHGAVWRSPSEKHAVALKNTIVSELKKKHDYLGVDRSIQGMEIHNFRSSNNKKKISVYNSLHKDKNDQIIHSTVVTHNY